jgi:RecB family exonuclease
VRERRAFPIVTSASGGARLDAATAWLGRLPANQPVNIVASSRGAADDLARRVAALRPATIGLSRFSLLQLAARTAITRLAGSGIAPATVLGGEAVAARAAFDAMSATSLTFFGVVAAMPGFPRALARTLGDLRSMSVGASDLARVAGGGADLAQLLERADRAFADSATADRVRLLAAAAEGAADDHGLAAPLLLLDLEVGTPAEEQFLDALIGRAREVCATAPLHDEASCAALERAGGVRSERTEVPDTDLRRLRAFLFAKEAPPEEGLDGSLEFFSAPGEGRECVEIVRRILAHARQGVRFDDMAVLVRAPQQYQGLLEHALDRAGVPAWFERGTRRPHPAGRAFLALLACAIEGLSARRFAEYLSLGQLPPEGAASAAWVPSGDEAFGRPPANQDGPSGDGVGDDEGADDDGDSAAIGGTLRTPRRWEQLLVEAAVVGGEPARWTRRLNGLAAEFYARLAEARREDPTSPRAVALERDLERLAYLRRFVVPLVTEMASWSPRAYWGEWLERLTRLAPRVLRAPAHVQRVLADLGPMAGIGPVGLAEVRGVLEERLLTVDAEPPTRRYGRVFVASPALARGRVFRVVFVPGLAERMFPQKPRQDPLLPDGARTALDRRLPTSEERSRRERLLLHLAAGAATERLCVSYPRIDVAEARARVPSFYALDLVRAATGRMPDHEALARAAARAGDAMLAWPAPTRADQAIDDQEHDLGVLRRLLDADDPALARGRAQYLLTLNPALRRSVTERWARGERRWSHFDGLIRVTDRTRDALSRQRFGNRAYSLSALQRFATCPYQFLLSAIYRLHPAEQREPLQRLDPLTRGSLVHRIQAVFLRELRTRGALPVTPASIQAAGGVLEDVFERIAAEYREALVPAIERVWQDELAVIARDLRGWLRKLAEDGAIWTPEYFELAFGLPHDEARDPHSVPDPVVVGGRFPLRGSIDLVERNRLDGTLRVTDHKTGKNRSTRPLVIGGGEVLQPVLYSLVVEAMTGTRTASARLSFCTAAGGFTEEPVPMTDDNRRLGVEVLEIVDRAIERGELAPAPRKGACLWCDFRVVCGPDEEVRVGRKPPDRLHDLVELRSRP